MNRLKFIGILSLLLFLSGALGAATYTCVANGNWNVAATWGGTVPTAADNAVIASGFTVTVTAAASITNVTVNGQLNTNSALTVNAAGVFTINGGGVYVHNNATTASTSIFKGSESFNSASSITISNWSSLATPLITGVGSSFGNLNLAWNTNSFVWNNNGLGVGTNIITGNFTVSNSCCTYLNNVAGNVTFNIGGNFSLLTNGYIELKRNSSGNVIFNVAGSTTISGANSFFIGIVAYSVNSTGSLTYTTTNYTQSGGLFNGNTFTGAYAGGDVIFTATGAFNISGGQHIGVNFQIAGNWGIATYSMQSFTCTGGSIILDESVVTDGRTITWNVTNDFTCTFSSTADFVEMSGLIYSAQNSLYNLTVGGNFTIGGNASALFKIAQDGTGTETVAIANDLTITSAIVGFGDINTCTFVGTVGRHVTFTGGTTTYSNVATSHLDMILGTAAVTWNQTVGATVALCNTNVKSGKTVSLTGTLMGTIPSGLTITVETGGKLYCANATVTGAGAFTIQTGTTLGIGSIAGITSTGATGNVQVTGTRTYNSGATYEYYQGLTPQITGNFTTTTTNATYPCQVANLVINKSLPTDIVTLTKTTDVLAPGVLTLTMGILTTSYTAATAPWVRIPSGSSVSPVGGSANSYVDGYIRKAGNASFIFPTGNGGKWRRIEMTAPSISTEFEARYINAPYSNTTTMAGSPSQVLNHVSLIEHWFLSKPLGVDAATAKVKLYWEDASASGILKFDSLTVARWNGAAWEDANCYSSCPANWTSSQPERTYTGSATSTGAGTIQSNTVSNFSPFTFGSIGLFNNNPLPIELSAFSGYYNNVLNVLNWTTESETNNNYFTIERTFDGVNYEEVTRVNGAGNSTHAISYSATDDKQYTGVAYYRLKQTDFNGQFKYSGIVPITHENSDHVSILPNPVSGSNLTVNLNSSSDGMCHVQILDLTGKVVASQEYVSAKGDNSFELDVANLSKGMYFITIQTNDQFKKIKFLKE